VLGICRDERLLAKIGVSCCLSNQNISGVRKSTHDRNTSFQARHLSTPHGTDTSISVSILAIMNRQRPQAVWCEAYIHKKVEETLSGTIPRGSLSSDIHIPQCSRVGLRPIASSSHPQDGAFGLDSRRRPELTSSTTSATAAVAESSSHAAQSRFGGPTGRISTRHSNKSSRKPSCRDS
jgi:hypothetical protein